MSRFFILIIFLFVFSGCSDEPYCSVQHKQNDWEKHYLKGKVKFYRKTTWWLREDSLGEYGIKGLKPSNVKEYFFDSTGELSKKRWCFYEFGDTTLNEELYDNESCTNCEYDEVGNLLMKNEGKDCMNCAEYVEKYKYDKCGNKTEEKTVGGVDDGIRRWFKFKYNIDNKITHSYHYSTKDSLFYLDYEYLRSEDNKQIEILEFHESDSIYIQSFYNYEEFDKMGNWVDKTEVWGLEGKRNYGKEIPYKIVEREITYFED